MNKILTTLVLVIIFICFSNRVLGQTVNLKCDFRVNPIGIDNTVPRLSWQTENNKKDWLQTAYQIVVSTSPNFLSNKKYIIWDSGIVFSGESVSIPYNGSKLESGKRYWWSVRVWDKEKEKSKWAKPAFWEMGLLNEAEWEAKWISHNNPQEQAQHDSVKWVWVSGVDPLKVPLNTVAWFRTEIDITETPAEAVIQTMARGNYDLIINGKIIDSKSNWQAFEYQGILKYLKVGKNTIVIKTTTTKSPSTKNSIEKTAGLAALVQIKNQNGGITYYSTPDKRWEARYDNQKEWKQTEIIVETTEITEVSKPSPLAKPAVMIRKKFSINKEVKSARLYITALGSYQAFINGNRVGNDVLTPEFTEYSKRVTYQTYDITSLLKEGKNVISSLLGDGWFSSPLGWDGERNYFMPGLNRLLAEIHYEFIDGSRDKIITDDSWKIKESPIRLSEIYAGEYYDARLEQPGWASLGFDDTQWEPAKISEGTKGKLSSQINTPVKVTSKVIPKNKYQLPNGKWIFDMGQNMVGWAKLKVKGNSGDVVKMRFAEKTNPDGSIYVENLRNASVTDTYVLKGAEQEVFTPHFTFHGFRYIELSGYPGKLMDDSIIVEVISSVSARTGEIITSNELINSMYSLGIWGQRGNFISVPTDCPQRDERLGYTGDGQVFWRTGAYNYNISSFTRKWMRDITDEQTDDGSFTNTAPGVPKRNKRNGAPGWVDAGVIVPWTTWMQYGDKSVIIENWDAMMAYMDYVQKQSENYIRPGSFLGDWLGLTPTPQTLISTAFWAKTSMMMSQMAKAIGKKEESKQFNDLTKKIKLAFQNTFIDPNGKIGNGSQTSYVLALHTNLVPEYLKATAIDNLVKEIEAHNWHLTTGFLGTPYLLFALSENGRSDVAYKLLLNKTYPSWGYMIEKGATTWWERWNGDTGDPAMNSYNHYAFGSVVEWMYRAMTGINPDPEAPGFKKIIIKPVIDRTGKVTTAKGKYRSVYGEITSEWMFMPDNKAILKVKIPANTTARIVLPIVASITGVKNRSLLEQDNSSSNSSIEIGSGLHEFEIKL